MFSKSTNPFLNRSHTQTGDVPIANPTDKFDPSFYAKEAILSLEGVSKSYGRIKALKNVNFNIGKGEIVFVTGKSGAGKSTLLKVLAGEVKADKGIVKIPKNQDKFFAANIFQDLRVLPELTVKENLTFAFDSALYQSKDDFLKDLMELCRILEVDRHLHLKIRDVNGGLKQKVAVIRALLCKPQIILADEPTSSLDNYNAQKLYELFNIYRVKRKTTIVWATHNTELVRSFNAQMAHLENGELVYSGHACFI